MSRISELLNKHEANSDQKKMDKESLKFKANTDALFKSLEAMQKLDPTIKTIEFDGKEMKVADLKKFLKAAGYRV